ncbi:tag-290 [Pristionchus pacificus]|uniref:Tag-290 protein n=1 Tax=Pristionchus pacificus TaxID=54126 RepID=A0A2A6CSX9_PRIPA|nr:tag-290 [Pristionchus pacificus]|eukprot:PDM81220.1 tag-290 protein [Pristionchus pacificus]
MLSFVLLLSSFSLSLAADCTSSRDSGVSCEESASSFSFYYDSRSKVCQPFMYKGCGGNSNRYSSRDECLSVCSPSASTTSSPSSSSSSIIPSNELPHSQGSQWLQGDKCGSNFLIPNHEYINCNAGRCPDNHNCVNGEVCCPTKSYICSLRDDSGSFREGIDDKPRFAWDAKVNSCVRFSYYGANGNYNNFPNFYSCLRFCQN